MVSTKGYAMAPVISSLAVFGRITKINYLDYITSRLKFQAVMNAERTVL